MPEITLDESQVEYLEDLREHIAAEHVGPYGHVRMREAVQFLIDRHEAEDSVERETVRRVVEESLADRSYQELQSLAADTEGVEPGGKAEELRERLREARVSELLGGDATDAADAEADDGGEDADGAGEDGGDAGDGSRLQRMMGLLDRHDDVWTETDSDEGKYAVTLPDGNVENVRTKDDVRALLFQHYD